MPSGRTREGVLAQYTTVRYLMNKSILDSLKKAGFNQPIMESSDFDYSPAWYNELHLACKKIADSVDSDYLVLQDFNFNAMASYTPKYIALRYGVFDLSYKIALVVADLIDNGKKCFPDESDSNPKTYKELFGLDTVRYFENNHFDEKLKNDSFRHRFELISSIFTLFTMFHEAGHIYHMHGLRHNSLDIDDIDNMKGEKLTEEEALNSQSREFVSDMFALQGLVDNHLKELKKFIDNMELYKKVLCDYFTYLNLYFYFLSPKLSESDFKYSSHPPASIRLHMVSATFFHDEQLGLNNEDKDFVIYESRSSMLLILDNLFNDKKAKDWLYKIPERDVDVWYSKIRKRAMSHWYLYGIDRNMVEEIISQQANT